jgi:hypothetical protein
MPNKRRPSRLGIRSLAEDLHSPPAPPEKKSGGSQVANAFLKILRRRVRAAAQKFSNEDHSLAGSYAGWLVLGEGSPPAKIAERPALQKLVQDEFVKLCREKRMRPRTFPGQDCDWFVR